MHCEREEFCNDPASHRQTAKAVLASAKTEGNIRPLPDAYVKLGKGDIVSLYIGPQDDPKIPRR